MCRPVKTRPLGTVRAQDCPRPSEQISSRTANVRFYKAPHRFTSDGSASLEDTNAVVSTLGTFTHLGVPPLHLLAHPFGMTL